MCILVIVNPTNHLHLRVIVVCVASEITIIINPAEHYSVDRIRLIDFIKRDEGHDNNIELIALYVKIFNIVIKQLKDTAPRIEVVRHRGISTYDIYAMVR